MKNIAKKDRFQCLMRFSRTHRVIQSERINERENKRKNKRGSDEVRREERRRKEERRRNLNKGKGRRIMKG
jgi:hypothetical protein